MRARNSSGRDVGGIQPGFPISPTNADSKMRMRWSELTAGLRCLSILSRSCVGYGFCNGQPANAPHRHPSSARAPGLATSPALSQQGAGHTRPMRSSTPLEQRLRRGHFGLYDDGSCLSHHQGQGAAKQTLTNSMELKRLATRTRWSRRSCSGLMARDFPPARWPAVRSGRRTH